MTELFDGTLALKRQDLPLHEIRRRLLRAPQKTHWRGFGRVKREHDVSADTCMNARDCRPPTKRSNAVWRVLLCYGLKPPTPKPLNWHRSSYRPSDCGIRAGAIRLAIQVCLSNRAPKLLLRSRIETANVLGDRALLTEIGRPEVVERCVIHSDDQHCVADIGKAGIAPGVRKLARTSYRSCVVAGTQFIGPGIQYRGSVPENPVRDEAAPSIPNGRGNHCAWASDPSHLRDSALGVRHEVQHQLRKNSVEGAVPKRQRACIPDAELDPAVAATSRGIADIRSGEIEFHKRDERRPVLPARSSGCPCHSPNQAPVRQPRCRRSRGTARLGRSLHFE